MTALLLFAQSYWRPIALGVMLVASVLAVYGMGRNHEREAWQTRNAKTAAAAAKETMRLVEKNYRIELEVAEVIEVERIITKKIYEKVDVYVPSNACPLPGGFRVLHDAAARGVDPIPASATDAAPVPAQDAARTVIDNYGACREDQARLVKLQEWAAGIANTKVLCASAN